MTLKEHREKRPSSNTELIMRLIHFPKIWKEAEVIMVKKPRKNAKFPPTYRPISLLAAISKVEFKTDSREIFPSEQFGFRERLRLTGIATEGIFRQKTTGLLILDIERVFWCTK